MNGKANAKGARARAQSASGRAAVKPDAVLVPDENAEWLDVESLDLDGQGVAHNAAGKVVFIEGALPGEQVQVRVKRSKGHWEQGVMTALRRESAQRVVPRCPYFGEC
ncbi:MAG: putative rRNA (uracil-5-)-methyltransferase, partial [Rhizobacter sp.]|nr:putative rRNA (uracil-5-)-methyltransferase [Rhizobacter sp.]